MEKRTDEQVMAFINEYMDLCHKHKAWIHEYDDSTYLHELESEDDRSRFIEHLENIDEVWNIGKGKMEAILTKKLREIIG